MKRNQRRRATVVLAATAAVCSAVLTWGGGAMAGPRPAASARAAARQGTWGSAQEIPGVAALNRGGHAGLASVSCVSPGNCSAGGYYTDSSRHALGFVVSEVNGTWHTAIEVPGLAALNAGFGAAGVESVSCASAGNCSAGGNYEGTRGNEPFVVSEVNGTWHTAIEVPGLASRNFGSTMVTSVSCASAGNCTAGGTYTDSSFHGKAFVVSETNGTWHTAATVPGTPTLDHGGGAGVSSVSCASAGNCTTGGSYTDQARHLHVFAASEVKGTWQRAIEIPGTATLSQGNGVKVESVSCASPGNCSADGYYITTSGGAYVVSEVNGTWGTATQIPGSSPLSATAPQVAWTVSCASPGNCTAGGDAEGPPPAGGEVAFAVNQVNGTWGAATELPGVTLTSASSTVQSLSCASAGNCSAGGYYQDGSRHLQAFVTSEVNGTWASTIEVPGTASLNKHGNAQVSSVSCGAPGNCAAGGHYTDSSGHSQAFVVNQA